MPFIRARGLEIKRSGSANRSGARPGWGRSHHAHFSYKFIKLKNISLFLCHILGQENFVRKIQRRGPAYRSRARPGCERSHRFYFSYKVIKAKNISLCFALFLGQENFVLKIQRRGPAPCVSVRGTAGLWAVASLSLQLQVHKTKNYFTFLCPSFEQEA